MTSITIIGAGEIGQAMAYVLRKNSDISLSLWDVDESKVPDMQPLSVILPTSDIVLFCIPSWTIVAGIEKSKEHISKGAAILSVAKGIEGETGKYIDELLGDAFPGHGVGLIYGPMLAEEIVEDRLGHALLASSDANVREYARLFSGTNFIVRPYDDIRGTAIAGVLKNVYALGLGIMSALDFGENAGGWYIGRAIGEMADIIERLGGRRETAYKDPGLGDMVATAFSRHSQNRQTGAAFAKTGEFTKKSEGLLSLPSLMKSLGDDTSKYPLLSAISDIIEKKRDLKDAYQSVMNVV